MVNHFSDESVSPLMKQNRTKLLNRTARKITDVNRKTEHGGLTIEFYLAFWPLFGKYIVVSIIIHSNLANSQTRKN